MTDRRDKWPIGCCACGNFCDCIVGCCFPIFAIPLARSNMDGSECCFNMCCVNGVVTRWLVRTGYGIPEGGIMEDCCIPYCCCPCNSNQIYQTSKMLGPLKNGGKRFNKNKWQDPVSTSNCDCGLFCYSCCCMQCAVGTVVKDSLGMPWCMGCCCMNCCTSRNLIRYHYRIQGNDCCDECLAPLTYQACLCCISSAASLIIPCTSCCLIPLGIIPMVVFLSAQLQESRTRGGGDNHRYIAGYDTAAPVIANVVAPPGMSAAAVMPTAQYVQPQYEQLPQKQYEEPAPQNGQIEMQTQQAQPADTGYITKY